MSSKIIAGRSFDFVLSEYRDEPDADVFKLRVLSGDDNDKLLSLHSAAVKEQDAAKRAELMNQIFDLVVTHNPLGAPLLSVLTVRECQEIIGAVIEGASLTREERKKFVLRPTSGQGLSDATQQTCCLSVPSAIAEDATVAMTVTLG